MRSFFVGLAIAGLCACGNSLPPTPACTPQSCAGCCDPNGFCEIPAANHCGVGGAACVTCSDDLACVEGACREPASSSASSGSNGSSSDSTGSSGSSSGSGSGSGSGTGSGTGTGTGSGSGSGSSGSVDAGDCCLALNCPVACDPYACQCLAGGSSSTTGGGYDAGSLCQTQSCVIYAETARTLYQVDPNPPNALTRLCNFGGAIDAGVNDIAVRSDGTLYGITRTDLYSIAPGTCAGTHLARLASGAGSYNCLTFTSRDTLVAADANGQVVTIDAATGQVADAGQFGGGYGCSGDIVALSNGQVYATAKYLRDAGVKDMLVTLDPASGYAATRVSNATLGYKSIFGLGYWAGSLYGFDAAGDELVIDPVAGTSTFLRNVPNTTFYGAGTTPLAPVVTH